jgi:hypothetical protein
MKTKTHFTFRVDIWDDWREPHKRPDPPRDTTGRDLPRRTGLGRVMTNQRGGLPPGSAPADTQRVEESPGACRLDGPRRAWGHPRPRGSAFGVLPGEVLAKGRGQRIISARTPVPYPRIKTASRLPDARLRRANSGQARRGSRKRPTRQGWEGGPGLATTRTGGRWARHDQARGNAQ